VEPIDQVKSNLSLIFPNAASLLKTNHQKSAQNSEKSSYSQRVLTEKLLRIFPLATTHAKVANSGSDKMVIARYRIRYFFQKRGVLSPTVLKN